MKTSIFYLMLPFLLFGNVEGPSFECNQKLSSIETSICTSKELSKLDLSLSELYNKVYSTLRSTQDLKFAQRQWVKTRNQCKDNMCLIKAYQTRIEKLKQITPTKLPYEPKLIYSKSQSLCREVLLNYTKEYYEDSALAPKQKSSLTPLEWKEQLPVGHKMRINSLGKINLKYKQNKHVSLLRWIEPFNWKGDRYSAFLYPSTLHDINFNDINKSQLATLKSSGKEIYPNATLTEDFNNTKYGLYSSEWRDVDIFTYKNKYYYENKLNNYWSVNQKNIGTLEILEDGTLKPTCVVQMKYEGENLLLKKQYFSEFLSALSNMTGGYGSCGTLSSGGTILSLRIPTTLEKISFKPWKKSLYPRRDKQLNVVDVFLEEWGYRGLWNYDVYQRYLRVKDKAKQDLVDYYLQTFKVDKQTANSYATSAYDQIVSAHFNIPYYGTSPKPQDSLREALLKGKTVEEIKPMLTGEWKGPKKNSYFEDTESTLFYALPHPHLVKLLLDEGIDINSSNPFGKTALMYAAQYNLYDTAKLLLESNTGVNKQTTQANDNCSYTIRRHSVTALHYAVRYADSKFIKLLLDNGADKEIRDTEGKTAYDWIELFKDESKILNKEKKLEITKLLEPKSIANLNLALKYYKEKDYKHTAYYYEKVLEDDKKNSQALSNLAFVYYKLGEYQQAAKFATKNTYDFKATKEQRAASSFYLGVICSQINKQSNLKNKEKSYCTKKPFEYFLKSYEIKPSASRAEKIIQILSASEMEGSSIGHIVMKSEDNKITILHGAFIIYLFSEVRLDKEASIHSEYGKDQNNSTLLLQESIDYKNKKYFIFRSKQSIMFGKVSTNHKICYDKLCKESSEILIIN